MTVQMNPWEEQALAHTTSGHLPDPRTFDPLIYPGLYSPSGIDILTILISIHARPNPTIALGPVDTSCAMLISDLSQPDQPIVYASEAFTHLTGYTAREVLGRNCRFLQAPPPPPSTSSPSPSSSPPSFYGYYSGVSSSSPPPQPQPPTNPPLQSKTLGGTATPNTITVVRESGKHRGYGVDMETVRKMRRAVLANREVQVEVVNYTKSGRPFVNLLTIIPVQAPVALAAAPGGPGMYNFSVGLLCDLSSLEED